MLKIVGPALRVLLAEGRAWKLLKYEEGEEKGDIVIPSVAGCKSAGKVVEHLKRSVARGRGGVGRVVVEELGTFSVTEPVMKGRAAGKVALVTGAAQGFGREIAEHLAQEGAVVVMGDVNEAGVKEGAAGLCDQLGPRRALGVKLDVTDGKSIEKAVEEVVREYGGMDVVISNAGILRAGSVKTQEASEFAAVTEVNYKGYFLVVQKTAGVLGVGHLADEGYTSDIIQINSKSGLAGSNRNSAYSGSKFGGIGLTQSFALELMEDGIKVNAICPGNFFDGPLWSDPETGLFVQYLRTGKVPGAKSVEEVRKAYEAKAPMGRGCRTIDVMRAIYYAMEQQYETGQAIPVTGGQVMLG